MQLTIQKFASNNPSIPLNSKEIYGSRAFELLRLAELNVPIAPGYVIDATHFKNIDQYDLDKALLEGSKYLEKHCGKKANDPDKPLTIKIVPSPASRNK